jgi:hypothetical protein
VAVAAAAAEEEEDTAARRTVAVAAAAAAAADTVATTAALREGEAEATVAATAAVAEAVDPTVPTRCVMFGAREQMARKHLRVYNIQWNDWDRAVGMGCRVEGSGCGNIVIFFLSVCLSFFLSFYFAGLSRYPTGGLKVTRKSIVCLVIFVLTELGWGTILKAMPCTCLQWRGLATKEDKERAQTNAKGGNSVGANACLQLPRAEGC